MFSDCTWYDYVYLFPPSFIGASSSVVDGEEEQTTLTVAERGYEMGGFEGGFEGGGSERVREREWFGCVTL